MDYRKSKLAKVLFCAFCPDFNCDAKVTIIKSIEKDINEKSVLERQENKWKRHFQTHLDLIWNLIE